MKPGRRFGWSGSVRRSLALFWGGISGAVIILGAVLQWLGPLEAPVVKPPSVAEHAAPVVHAPAPAPVLPPAPTAPPPPPIVVPKPPVVAAPLATRPPGSAIPAPSAALLEAAPNHDGAQLPRIGADGLLPSQAYAGGFDPTSKAPRIAILLADFGVSGQASEEAIRGLPAAVSFAVSPYGARTPGLLEAARARGHELLAVVPMEPSNFPLNDPGPEALLTGAAPLENARRLEWALSRFTGYVGVTAVLGRMHGDRFANAPELFSTMLEELARRGLLYVDPRTGGAPPRRPGMPAFRAVDLVVDSPAVRAEVDERLAQLERRAREGGVAIGLAEEATPMVVDRIAAWANSLPVRGFVLVPVSAIVAPP